MHVIVLSLQSKIIIYLDKLGVTNPFLYENNTSYSVSFVQVIDQSKPNFISLYTTSDIFE